MKQFLALLFIALALIGCNNNDTTLATEPTSLSFTISPTDNQTAVSQSAHITLTFNKAVDKSVVENNFRLINTLAYVDSLCPVSKTIIHGSMAMSMMDSSTMNHLESIHGLQGTFSWSNDNKTCVFTPDTLLRQGLQHMIHIREQMATMFEDNMGSMSMMGRNGMGSQMGMSFHFTTK